jgi:hypothetical protein
MDKALCPFNYAGQPSCECSLRCAILQGQKPRVRVKARGRMIGNSIPLDAQPGDLIVGNRGAAAVVQEWWTSSGLSSVLNTLHIGNVNYEVDRSTYRRVYDRS